MLGSLRTSGRAFCSASSRQLAVDSREFRAALWALLLLLLLSCTRRGPEQPVVAVEVVDRSGPGVGSSSKLDRRALEETAKRAISRIPGFVAREARPEEIGWQLSVMLELTLEREARPDDAGLLPPDRVYRGVGVRTTLRALRAGEGEHVGRRYESDLLLGRNTPLFDDFSTLSKEAILLTMDDLATAVKVRRAPDAELVASLESRDARGRAHAIAAIKERRLAVAVPKLIEILKSKDQAEPDVVLEAIAALVAIRDPRAVGALIDSATGRSPAYLSQVVFGVAEIGGKEAEAFLYTLATGHPDAAIRQSAEDALRELERRGGRARGGDDDG